MFVVLTEKIIGGISVMKKKMFSFLLTFLLVVGLMPNGVLAVETTTSGTWGAMAEPGSSTVLRVN